MTPPAHFAKHPRQNRAIELHGRAERKNIAAIRQMKNRLEPMMPVRLFETDGGCGRQAFYERGNMPRRTKKVRRIFPKNTPYFFKNTP